MTGQDPESLQIFAYCALAVGILQLGYGLFQKRSPDRDAQMVALIMIWGAVGFFVAAAVCYFYSHIDWIMAPALVACFTISGVGSILAVRKLKSGGNSSGDIVS